MIRKLFWGLLLLTIQMFINPFAFAEDEGLLRMRASAGFSSYALTLTGAGSSSPDATSQYFAVGGGITYATGNMYFDAYGSMSLMAEHDWPGYEGDFKRMDTALTAGYLLNGGWSLFGGYKWGKSDIYQNNRPGYVLTFEAYGLFGGLSKSIRLANGSSVSLSGALAFMTGDVYDNDTLNDSGKAVGTSVTASYNMPIGGSSGMQFRGFYQYYGFSEFTSVADVEETILGIDAAYYLNF